MGPDCALFGKRGQTIVVLLTGGAKGNQKRDIAKAKRYWLDYNGAILKKEFLEIIKKN